MNIKYRALSPLLAGIISLAIPGLACAAPISGQGTWETTLQARDLDGDPGTIDAFYDTTLNITWLADAALSKTVTYGIPGTLGNGRLEGWNATNDWIAAMNSGTGYLGYTNWRSPIILDTSILSKILGFNSDPARSEFAHLFYVTLANVANVDVNGNTNPNPGLKNTANFNNFQKYYYWTGTEYSSTNAWSFAMHSGDQYRRAKTGYGYPLPVLDGDVGTAVNDGDINNDGNVDTSDLILATQILLNQYTPTLAEQSRWDIAPLINGIPTTDSKNNMGDYLILTQKVLGLVNF